MSPSNPDRFGESPVTGHAVGTSVSTTLTSSFFLRGGSLLGPRSFEYAFHGVIALMTRVLIDWPWRLRQRNFTFPDACKCRRIVDRELVHDGVRAGARKTLDQVQVFVGAPEVRFVGEVCRVDDQCIAFPPASRVQSGWETREAGGRAIRWSSTRPTSPTKRTSGAPAKTCT